MLGPVLIPAYQPGRALVKLVRRLSGEPVSAVIIVDDGSGPGYRSLFEELRLLPRVHIVRHAINLGKGAALKTGINYALCNFPSTCGLVTADADGQHAPEDILAVAAKLKESPTALILGTRQFSGTIPLRSYLGNTLTHGIFRALVGEPLADTQTGLRGIPAALLPALLPLSSTGYDFELDMLLKAKEKLVPILQQPIRTIYHRGNITSHFNPLIDSMKIYFVLLRFSSVSLVTALIDNLVFFAVWNNVRGIAVAQLAGRMVAVLLNYIANRHAVFDSQKRHAMLLPRYLLLVFASGSVSYVCIRLLTSTAGFTPIWAKLLVESGLFFANFVIQRDFIFANGCAATASDTSGSLPGIRRAPVATSARAVSSTPATPEPRPQPWLLWAVLIGAIFLAVQGYRVHHVFAQYIWDSAGLKRLERLAWVFTAVSLAVSAFRPALLSRVLIAAAFFYTIACVGAAPILAVAALLFSSFVLGALLLKGKGKDLESGLDNLIATMTGIGVYLFVLFFCVRLPVNYASVYLGLLALPPIAVPRRAADCARRCFRMLRSAAVENFPDAYAFALAAFVLTAHWLVALKPDISPDALAMHLAIPANIAWHHRFTFPPSQVLWAAMPIAGDMGYTLVYVLAGEYAARLLNLAMLLMVAGLLFAAVRPFLARPAAWLIVALFSSCPLVQLVTGNLFIENTLAAFCLAGLVALWRFGQTGRTAFLAVAAWIFGMAMEVKLGALAFILAALPMAVILLWTRIRSLPRRFVLAAAMLGLFSIPAAVPYVHAWRETGNPIYPFLNEKLHSRFLDPHWVFRDYRFHEPLTWHTLYDLTFHCERYFEGQAGSPGPMFIILVPVLIVAFLYQVARRARKGGESTGTLTGPGVAVPALGISAGASLLMLKFQPNLRYLYPAIPVFCIAVAGALWQSQRWHAAFQRTLVSVIAAIVLTQIYLLPASGWYHKDFYIGRLLRNGDRDYLREAAPVRLLTEWLNRNAPGEPVLFVESVSIAGLHATAWANMWHYHPFNNRLQLAKTQEEIFDLMRQLHVRWFVVPDRPIARVNTTTQLVDFLAHHTIKAFSVGGWSAARLRDDGAMSLTPPVSSRTHSPTGRNGKRPPAREFAFHRAKGWSVVRYVQTAPLSGISASSDSATRESCSAAPQTGLRKERNRLSVGTAI